jgi:AcrR family transcriptional regulator
VPRRTGTGSRAPGAPLPEMQYVPPMPQPRPASRTTAQRLRVRQELSTAAMRLFSTKGYEATTVDEIAAAAGVARRTFFRHFRSKEEAIFPDHDDTLVRVQAVLDRAEPDDHPLDTVCNGITEVLRMYAESPRVSVERYRLTREVPALREHEIASVARYDRLFTRYLLGHIDSTEHRRGEDDPLLAEVAASAVVAAHNHVLRRWLRAGGKGDVEQQLDHAFAVLRHTLSPWMRVGGPEAPGATDGTVGVARRVEVVVAVTRTDAPAAEVARAVERALNPGGRGAAVLRAGDIGGTLVARSVFTDVTRCHTVEQVRTGDAHSRARATAVPRRPDACVTGTPPCCTRTRRHRGTAAPQRASPTAETDGVPDQAHPAFPRGHPRARSTLPPEAPRERDP